MVSSTLTQIQTSIQAASKAASHKSSEKPKAVTLLAVSKKQSADAIEALYKSGQRHFGENYVQEAVSKQDEISTNKSCPEIVWHFIGPIQSNKTRSIAENFAWVHSVDRLKIAQRLDDQRPTHMGKLNVCIQVNIDKEDSKSGVSADQASELAKSICSLPHLSLRGLMIIPTPSSTQKSDLSADNVNSFFLAKELFEKIKKQLREDPTIPTETRPAAEENFDTLSMGMSNDYEQAIAHGATIVRIGTKLFGKRS